MASRPVTAGIACHCTDQNKEAAFKGLLSSLTALATGLTLFFFAIVSSETSCAITQIDVLVAYTHAAKLGVADINTTVDIAMAESNESFVNSSVNIHLNLVDSFEVAYSEMDTNGNRKPYDTMVTDFAAMQDVNQRRDQSAADVAVLIVSQPDYCGWADAIGATASTAFAVVYYDCATGYYSFVHEIGHLMGARHNNDPAPGIGHGYVHKSPEETWRTIMALNCNPANFGDMPNNHDCPRFQYWSNPNILYDSVPMGTKNWNNVASLLNNRAGTVAAFRPIKSLQPSPLVTIILAAAAIFAVLMVGFIWRFILVPNK